MTGLFYTPPFSAADRERVFRVLGFGRLEFCYLEMAGETVLRGRQYTRAGVVPLLCSGPLKGQPVLIRRRPEGKVKPETLRFNLTPWESLFPYPLSFRFVRLLSKRGLGGCGNISTPSSLFFRRRR